MASQPFSHTNLCQSPFVCVRNYAFGVFHNGDRSPLVPRTARAGRRRTAMRLQDGAAKHCSALPSDAKPEKVGHP